MICRGCNYPIPSWQHNGACKPVEDKVPPIMERIERGPSGQFTRYETAYHADVPEIPTDVPKKRGRPGKWESEAERKAAYRERKKQG